MAELLAGRYELVDRLGIRGVPERDADPDAGPPVATADAVWRVWDHKAGSYVAAKVMQHGSAATLLRFVREASPRLRHRHVVTPTGWAGVGNLVLFTMPLVRGGSVAQLVAEVGPLPVQWMATLLDQLLDALATAHSVNVVHGDVRAQRLLLEPSGHGAPRLRLSGFGSRPTDGDQRDDLSAVGAMAAGLVVGLGGYERVTTSAQLEHSAPLGIPAVFWDLLAQLTDGDLTAEQARTELAQTGCLPDDWSMVHDDAIVETVDKLPPYPAGWGPRGPIGFAAPGFVRNDLPRSLDDQPVESGGFPLTRPEPASPTDPSPNADSHPGKQETASHHAVPTQPGSPEFGGETGESHRDAGERREDHPVPEHERTTEGLFDDEAQHDGEAEVEGAMPAEEDDSALAALLRDGERSPTPGRSIDDPERAFASSSAAEGLGRTDDGSEWSAPEEHGHEGPGHEGPGHEGPGHEEPGHEERGGPERGHAEVDDPFGPIPELELEPTPRRWFRRSDGEPWFRLPDLSGLRSRLAGRSRRQDESGPVPPADAPPERQRFAQPPPEVTRDRQFPEDPATSPADQPSTGEHRPGWDAPEAWDRTYAEEPDVPTAPRSPEPSPSPPEAEWADPAPEPALEQPASEPPAPPAPEPPASEPAWPPEPVEPTDPPADLPDEPPSDLPSDLPDGPDRTHQPTGPRLPRPRLAEPLGEPVDDRPPPPTRGPSTRPRMVGPVVRLPALPTPSPREAESLRAMGIWALLVGAGLVLAAFAVLLFA